MKVLRLRDVKLPERGTPKSAGLDFFVPNDFGLAKCLMPGESINVPSGLKVAIPSGYALIAFNKSGVATKHSLLVGACVGDEDYQGELHLHVINVGTNPVTISSGMKLVQFILLPVLYEGVEEVESEEVLFPKGKTERGEGGFGSTNKELYKVIYKPSASAILDEITELQAINLSWDEAVSVYASRTQLPINSPISNYAIVKMP